MENHQCVVGVEAETRRPIDVHASETVIHGGSLPAFSNRSCWNHETFASRNNGNDSNAGIVLASRRRARQHLLIPFIELSYQSVKDFWMRGTKIRLLTLIER